jgi:hypothetical protein
MARDYKDDDPYWRRRTWRTSFDTLFEWAMVALLLALVVFIVYIYRH